MKDQINIDEFLKSACQAIRSCYEFFGHVEDIWNSTSPSAPKTEPKPAATKRVRLAKAPKTVSAPAA